MIKGLFFPERVGNYFLFKKTVLGFHITDTTVFATGIYLQGTSIKIIESFTEPLESPEKTSEAIAHILQKSAKYDAITSTIDSSLIMFKELTLPIIGEEKIAMVLGFELEPYLPFPAHQANIDFIVTGVDKEQKTSTIMVAAVQKKYIAEHAELFANAQIPLDMITADLISVYGFYASQIPTQEENTALIIADGNKTHIAFLKNNLIKRVRTLEVSLDETGWNKVAFTLDAFSQELGKVVKIVFMGDFQQSNLSKAKEFLGTACEILDIDKAFEERKIERAPTVSTMHINILSATAAYPAALTEDFNLLAEETMALEKKRYDITIATAGILSLTILLSLSVHTFFQVRKLSVAADTAKNKVIKELKKNFPGLKGTSLRDVIKNAKKEIEKEERIWFPFSSQTRQSFLRDLYALSTHIDREVLGLNLKKMAINKENITMDGSVRNFEAIEEFEKQLKETKLFTQVPELQQTTFSNLALSLVSQGDRS